MEQLADAESIDGQVATVCGLAVNSCPARTEFRTQDCAPEGTPDDSLCGVNPPEDAKCAHFSTSSYRCSMRCLSFDDCPGTDCLTGLGEPVCDL